MPELSGIFIFIFIFEVNLMEIAVAFKESMKLYEELSAKNENGREVYADYSKFRGDHNLLFRFTEATFDRFMQSQKL